VLEIRSREVAIVACHGGAAALDRLASTDALRLRIAPDELWLVAGRSNRQGLLDQAERWRATTDGNALVVDQTDGWTVLTVAGDERLEVFGRLSVAPPPAGRPALSQGALAGVPGKVLFADGAAHYFVPAPVGHHLEARIRDTSHDLGLQFAPATEYRPTAGAVGGNGTAVTR